MTKVIEHIYNRHVFKAIIATGYKSVELNSNLQSNYNMYIQSLDEHADLPYISTFDTDEDGLNDYDEIMFKNNSIWLVDNSKEDDVILCSYKHIVNSICGNMFYVQKGLERYCAKTLEDSENPQLIQTLYSCRILPINSDPTSVDGDGDGISDNLDRFPLCTSTKEELKIEDFFYNAEYWELDFFFEKGLVNNFPSVLDRIEIIEVCRQVSEDNGSYVDMVNILADRGVLDFRIDEKDLLRYDCTVYAIMFSEYEQLKADRMTFAEMTQISFEQWSAGACIWLSIVTFDLSDEYMRWCEQWDYSPEYKISLEQEKQLDGLLHDMNGKTNGKSYTGGRSWKEYQDLARDNAHANRITVNALEEREVGLQCEYKKVLGKIKRGPLPSIDFVDESTGIYWDVKSFRSAPDGVTKPSKGAYKLENCLDKIHNEFRKGNNVIVNISNLYPEHSKELINELTNDSKYSGKIIIINLFDDYIQVL